MYCTAITTKYKFPLGLTRNMWLSPLNTCSFSASLYMTNKGSTAAPPAHMRLEPVPFGLDAGSGFCGLWSGGGLSLSSRLSLSPAPVLAFFFISRRCLAEMYARRDVCNVNGNATQTN
jgi:hypothetical protein